MRRLSVALRVGSVPALLFALTLQAPTHAADADGAAPKAPPALGRTGRAPGAPVAAASSGSGKGSTILSDEMSDPRVRPTDPGARRLLAEGIQRSYTIARLVELIERSDVVVYLNLSDPPGKLPTSQTRLLFAAPNGWRYTSVWVNQRLLPLRRLEMLGHELQHVAEIVAAREVVDAESLQRLYERIGYVSWEDRAFETKGAAVVELQVNRELIATMASGPEQSADGPASGTALRRRLYDAYCTVCHGRDGRGRGAAAHEMSTPPPDLTVLAQRSGGTFPWSEVERCIRSTGRSPATGVTQAMPVWVERPAPHGDAGAAAYAREITAFVESLQRRQRP